MADRNQPSTAAQSPAKAARGPASRTAQSPAKAARGPASTAGRSPAKAARGPASTADRSPAKAARGPGEHSGSESSEGGERSGEHGGTESGKGGEESGTQFGLNETFDEVRAGARLVLAYDPDTNAFIGTVENTTGAALSRVRVEVHLSSGTELGPTTPIDLEPGQVVDVNLPATNRPFTSWSAHPEVG